MTHIPDRCVLLIFILWKLLAHATTSTKYEISEIDYRKTIREDGKRSSVKMKQTHKKKTNTREVEENDSICDDFPLAEAMCGNRMYYRVVNMT